MEAAVGRAFDSASGGWVETARPELGQIGAEVAARLQGAVKAELSSTLLTLTLTLTLTLSPIPNPNPNPNLIPNPNPNPNPKP